MLKSLISCKFLSVASLSIATISSRGLAAPKTFVEGATALGGASRRGRDVTGAGVDVDGEGPGRWAQPGWARWLLTVTPLLLFSFIRESLFLADDALGLQPAAEGAEEDVPPRVMAADDVGGGSDESALSMRTPWPSL